MLKRMRMTGAVIALVAGCVTLRGESLHAQVSQEIVLSTGNSTVVAVGAPMTRVSIGNPEVADPVVVSATEIVLTARAPGSTTLLIWAGGARSSYTVRVTADAATLQREFERLFPDETIEASAIANTLILSGEVQDRQVARRALQLARSLGDGQIIDNMAVPDLGQILLQVRFAEVSRSWMEELGPTLIMRDGSNLDVVIGPNDNVRSRESQDPDDPIAEAFSDAVNFFIFHEPSRVAAFVQALESKGLFKSLAEPNLLAMPAESASFLAGGEFPFPTLQGGGSSNAVTIQFKEFGIRLSFVPDITNSGAIRLWVAPEVSSLDFANGLVFQGFNIPALLSRKAETTIELEDGQTFAIAGLVDNTLVESVSQIPILGDIPILGELFKSRNMRQNRSELLVLVTPRIVRPLDDPPPIPTDEPETWKWDKSMRNPDDRPADGSDIP
jgi:pilus assembly protein CpaC